MTLLKSLLKELDKASQQTLLEEIKDLVKLKTGGLDFGFQMSDITNQIQPAAVKTKEQMDQERKDFAIRDAIKNFGQKEDTNSFNIQDI